MKVEWSSIKREENELNWRQRAGIDNSFEEFCFKENQRNVAIAGKRMMNKSFSL